MKSCFGTIFPDLEQLHFGKPVEGSVFKISLNSRGPGHRDRKLDIDLSAWQDCQQCADFRNCYDFSTAKLEMQRVLREF